LSCCSEQINLFSFCLEPGSPIVSSISSSLPEFLSHLHLPLHIRQEPCWAHFWFSGTHPS
jgi:hypothetical protein